MRLSLVQMDRAGYRQVYLGGFAIDSGCLNVGGDTDVLQWERGRFLERLKRPKEQSLQLLALPRNIVSLTCGFEVALCELVLRIRKGGIREEGGAFTIIDNTFFLMPTYEHQNAQLLRPEWVPRLHAIQVEPHDADTVTGASYAVMDTILQPHAEAQVNAASAYHIWNSVYIKPAFRLQPL